MALTRTQPKRIYIKKDKTNFSFTNSSLTDLSRDRNITNSGIISYSETNGIYSESENPGQLVYRRGANPSSVAHSLTITLNCHTRLSSGSNYGMMVQLASTSSTSFYEGLWIHSNGNNFAAAGTSWSGHTLSTNIDGTISATWDFDNGTVTFTSFGDTLTGTNELTIADVKTYNALKVRTGTIWVKDINITEL